MRWVRTRHCQPTAASVFAVLGAVRRDSWRVFWHNFRCDPPREDMPKLTVQASSRVDEPSSTPSRDAPAPPSEALTETAVPAPAAPREIGGREGPDPTRFGDWELRGRCIDF